MLIQKKISLRPESRQIFFSLTNPHLKSMDHKGTAKKVR